MEATQYDTIVSSYNSVYDDLQTLPCGQLEEANLHAAVATHVGGKRVLDLGCGSGHYTLRLLDWGAQSVIGVDLSAGMIEEARQRAKAREGVEFVVGDVSKSVDLIAHAAPFDLVVGTWLLNYASNANEMVGMWRSIAANLMPGGLFFGLTIPPPLGNREELDRAHKEDWASFGTDGHVIDEVEDGFAVHTVLGMPGNDRKVEFDNFYLRPEAFEMSCKTAGLEGGLEWLPVVLPESLREKFPSGYWNRLVLNPHFSICYTRR